MPTKLFLSLLLVCIGGCAPLETRCIRAWFNAADAMPKTLVIPASERSAAYSRAVEYLTESFVIQQKDEDLLQTAPQGSDGDYITVRFADKGDDSTSVYVESREATPRTNMFGVYQGEAQRAMLYIVHAKGKEHYCDSLRALEK